MSLKAKLEAVIYAAEEPVTLAQLSALFASEALAWKAEQAAGAESPEYAETEALETLLLLPPETKDPGLQPSGTAEVEVSLVLAEFPEPVASSDEASGPESSQTAEPAAEPAAEPEAESALEAKRLARLREREVRSVLRQLIGELLASYAADGRGVEIREVAGGYRMATKPEYHDAVRSFVKSLKPALKLSLPALETLAVIAYKQPVTAPEVNEIRGVDSSGVFGSLLARKLIATAGRKPVIGRPILYKTTREFLLRFGLRDVAELPSMEEFEKLAASELDEPEPSSSDHPVTNHPTPETTRSPEFNRFLEQDEAAEELAFEDSINPPDTTEIPKTAVMAASHESPTPDEAAPAAPPATEQAETETFPHADQEDRAEKDRVEESHTEESSTEKGSCEESGAEESSEDQ